MILVLSIGARGQPAEGKLSASDNGALVRGEAVVRILGSVGELSLPQSRRGAGEVISSLRKIRPNYLVEVVAMLPEASNPAALASLAASLADISGYVGIPYVSDWDKRRYPLFDKAFAYSRTRNGDGEVIEAVMHMKPFDDYRTRYSLDMGIDWLYFQGSNLDRLVYNGIAAVKVGDMAWHIVAYRSNGNAWFHGIGAVRAFDFFGAVRNRLAPSFIGRTKAFFMAMRKKMATLNTDSQVPFKSTAGG